MDMIDPNHICPGCMRQVRTLEEPCPSCGFSMENYLREYQSGKALMPMTILAGKYLLGKVIGDGGFGITYIGMDLHLQNIVAIKEYFPNGLVDRNTMASGNSSDSVFLKSIEKGSLYYQKGKEQIAQEARTLNALRSLPGIVTVLDFFEENNTAYIVMDYIRGITLKEYLNASGGFQSEEQTLKMMKPVMESLVEIHKKGIIHRDIAPKNIMISQDSMVLIDFGAARAATKSGRKDLTVVLTNGYAPQEQYRSDGVQGPWTDVYGLCATLYRILGGEKPPNAYDLQAEPLKTFAELGKQVSEKTERVIRKGMSFRTEDRFQSITELMEALYGEKENEPQTSHTGINTGSEEEENREEAPIPVSTAKEPSWLNVLIGAEIAGIVILMLVIIFVFIL